jgi:hypothetical protein
MHRRVPRAAAGADDGLHRLERALPRALAENHVGLRRYSAGVRLVARTLDLARTRMGGRRSKLRAHEAADPAAAAVRLASEYTPSFLPEVVRIVDEMRAGGALARERGLVLVDLDAWCRRELRPTEAPLRRLRPPRRAIAAPTAPTTPRDRSRATLRAQ